MITKLHILLSCSIIILFASASYPFTLDEIVERMQNKYEETKNFKADFTQTSVLKSIKQKRVSRGQVFIKKPGMMRWEYGEPDTQLIVSDGKVIWFYVPADKQVMMSKVNDTSDSYTLNVFLSGIGKLRDTFKIESESEETVPQSQYLLRLTPKKSHPNLTRLVIGINKEDFKVETSSTYDIYGNQTTVSFSNIEMNKEMSEDIFHFEIPNGVRVITQ
ncbi:MAG: outer membrane lipoprotein carrier protein LolA [Nitrospinae bacterium RIFCSPLOWO2_02_FULL_39_110]|nr:MAG: outer membrane lipoprotein carrier protein LolA [Nitrospinae bacterium RIFCSPHIGHO2_02_39_11]OGV98559.1 MAG: outer membrane lipoprotein carrier protein LolA [Nitrospinae bacterium RIFCSPHIGHO2_12_FULL_39_42]OGW01291.1 MAG: outer membrane lipoprotein carrier protein LolA [Nitrospinae bacterium RIFCSPLOWO2_02_39_17]OGW02288.1 MAG: outer membrane lipoprotein carrier protein LolA [Nitrospinae bacterium RIFCSPHIGHO2_02_FULL_39_82]OGW06511.1 MAG: outer membrane lipoprotein carrier protein Lol